MKRNKPKKKKTFGSLRIPISTRTGGELFKDKKKYTRKVKHQGGKGDQHDDRYHTQ